MKRWAALLRGINLGKRTLPMAELRRMLGELGFANARTLLASGNAVFEADEEDAGTLESRLEREFAARLGYRSDFLLRDGADIAAVLRDNPFPEVARERPSQLLVSFWRGPVPADLLQRIAAIYDGPERLAVVGRELYIDYPEGQGRSQLGPAMAKLKIPGVSTGRNWNTVVKLDAMLRG